MSRIVDERLGELNIEYHGKRQRPARTARGVVAEKWDG